MEIRKLTRSIFFTSSFFIPSSLLFLLPLLFKMNIKGEYANETGLEACLPCENGFIAPEEGSKVNYSHKCSFFFF
jgi:hypothetical protein